MNKQHILMKNNTIVSARYNISLVHNNLFILILYKLQKQKNGNAVCYISKQEFQYLITNKSSKTIPGIKKILDKMLDEKIYFKESDGWSCKYNIIAGYEYNKSEDLFKISVIDRVYDLLMNYKAYTPVNLKVFFALKSVYAQRLYDLLRLWTNTKSEITYKLTDLKDLLMLEDKYPLYGDFKRNVLEKGKKELNKTDMFQVSYKENKKGRSVYSITFTVKDLDKRVYFKEKTLDKPSPLNYIPNKSVLSSNCIKLFQNDFEIIDFTYEDMKQAFSESVDITLSKFDIDTITYKEYPYFKAVLNNKIKYFTDLFVKNAIFY